MYSSKCLCRFTVAIQKKLFNAIDRIYVFENQELGMEFICQVSILVHNNHQKQMAVELDLQVPFSLASEESCAVC